MMKEAIAHLEPVCQIHRYQARMGGCFLHEHPQQATSWTSGCIQNVLRTTGSDNLLIHMCIWFKNAGAGCTTLSGEDTNIRHYEHPSCEYILDQDLFRKPPHGVL